MNMHKDVWPDASSLTCLLGGVKEFKRYGVRWSKDGEHVPPSADEAGELADLLEGSRAKPSSLCIALSMLKDASRHASAGKDKRDSQFGDYHLTMSAVCAYLEYILATTKPESEFDIQAKLGYLQDRVRPEGYEDALLQSLIDDITTVCNSDRVSPIRHSAEELKTIWDLYDSEYIDQEDRQLLLQQQKAHERLISMSTPSQPEEAIIQLSIAAHMAFEGRRDNDKDAIKPGSVDYMLQECIPILAEALDISGKNLGMDWYVPFRNGFIECDE